MDYFTIKSARMRAFTDSFKETFPLSRYRTRRPKAEALATWDAVLDVLIINLAEKAIKTLNIPPSNAPVRIVNHGLGVATGHHGPSRYHQDCLRSSLVSTALEALKESGLISVNESGFLMPYRVHPEAPFLALVKSAGLAMADIGSPELREIIVLTDGSDNNALFEYTDTAATHRLRGEIQQINEFLKRAEITIADASVNTERRSLTRVFSTFDGSERFDLHGRLYGGFWIDLPREDRALLRIEGESIADLDFSSMFLSLAYLKAGFEPPSGDLYAIAPFEGCRAGLKLIINAMMFAPVGGWPENSQAEFPEGTRLNAVKTAILTHHVAVKDVLRPGLGFDLMFTESRIMLTALSSLMAAGIVALPMHDGLMCAASKADEARAAMQAASDEITGFALPVVRKG